LASAPADIDRRSDGRHPHLPLRLSDPGRAGLARNHQFWAPPEGASLETDVAPDRLVRAHPRPVPPVTSYRGTGC